MKIKVMTEREAKITLLNPFGLTKTCSNAEFPFIDVGVLELNRYRISSLHKLSKVHLHLHIYYRWYWFIS